LTAWSSGDLQIAWGAVDANLDGDGLEQAGGDESS
jgi:hypothetical protein